MDLFGKKSAKEKENFTQRVSAELKNRGFKDDEVKSFMDKVSNEATAEKPTAEETKEGAKPTSEESTAKGSPTDKTGMGGNEGSTQSAPQADPTAKPEGEVAPSAPQPDYKAMYEELAKASGALSNRLASLEDTVVKMGSLQPKQGFGSEQRVPNGTNVVNDDAESAAAEASKPRHSTPMPTKPQ